MRDETVNPYQSPAVSDAAVPEEPARPSDGAARRALLISFGVQGVFLGGLLFFAGLGINFFLACRIAAAFMAIIAGVHFFGYRLWQRQSARASSSLPTGGRVLRE